ncbi:MAG: bifunctional phosphopantothenoylcysteine decarboxylase/phosphopantothenate--cysteine ligase CoaBC [Rhodospirillaceae bacterium]|nr:bifunctional phosphopantothenoylcysteine decarboxylase/phosphopantothenate--cysteine ligase CoaBC [Rhodospirillaceae bacterium]MBT7954785.1 bifunctional phosphopantothenoylcysteine decarboxylase/phosphopantothenate--cysteine ligase CoaBC [Rhodospirillaceae bacterium]
MESGKRVLLIISGGIAAYKSLELIRDLRRREIAVRCILTKAGSQFVTPLSLGALTEDKVYQDLFSLTDESEMGHIELSRDADLVVVAPATANIMAKMRTGIADDLATTALLATDKPVMIAPAMNVRMWESAATQENLAILQERGVQVIGPEEGDMACNEYGMGRMSEPASIAEAIAGFFSDAGHSQQKSLIGKKAIVTSGPTHEAIDPVRYLANHSSGRQGHAIAKALAELGADTVLVSGPTRLPDPVGVTVKHVLSAEDMLAACEAALPADIVVCAAAVADWRVANPPSEKIKKNGSMPSLELVENPDILANVSQLAKNRPALVIGFAAETEDVVAYAQAKLSKKGCDWIVANDVSPETGTFGGKNNTVHVIEADTIEDWPTLSKEDVGQKLAIRIATYLENNPT